MRHCAYCSRPARDRGLPVNWRGVWVGAHYLKLCSFTCEIGWYQQHPSMRRLDMQGFDIDSWKRVA